MKYSCKFAQVQLPDDCDYSYPPAEMQLLWRLEDLHLRREALASRRDADADRCRLTPQQLRYTLPEHLSTASDVEAAIYLAVADLWDNYGIWVQVPEENTPCADEISRNQLSFQDFLSSAQGAA